MAEYHEDGCVMDVEILADHSDSEYERYTLKVINIKQKSLIFKSPKIGTAFDCSKKIGVSCYCLWRLIK